MQTETLNNKMEELQALSEHTQSSMTSEMMEVQMRIIELENVKVGGVREHTELLLFSCVVQLLCCYLNEVVFF